MTAGADDIEQRVHAEQIDALFAAIIVSVCGATVLSVFLVATMIRLGAAELRIGLVWSSGVALCAAAHILLFRAYRRDDTHAARWRIWARRFTAISFVEGLVWGWAPFGLVLGGHSDAKHLVLTAVAGVSVGAIPGFSPYLPAFFAFFVPATLGCLGASISSDDAVTQTAIPLVLVFIGAMGPLGVKANKSFKQLVELRIRSENLAEDLKRQKEIAEQASLAKSTFLAAASHDLRQPLHAIGLFVGALSGVALPSEGRRLVEKIEAATVAMDGLFAALLDISRLDAGVVVAQNRSFALKSLLNRVCGDYADEARAKKVSLVWKPSSAIVETDPILFERILRNLISNAVRYTQRGRIVVGCRRRGTKLRVQVWDTGSGIPANQHERVFQEYFQLANPERDRAKGLGLGLAIVRRLTDLLGCELSLHSEVGCGSCFEVAVPLSNNPMLVSETVSDDFTGALARGLVVVIDDELAIRQAMGSLLTSWGHDVIVVSSGDEALERLSTCTDRLDLIICDYRLRDGESGIDVIDRLRSEYNEIVPAILVTGDTAPDRLAEAQASGLILLHKPVPAGKLRAAIINLIISGQSP
jgi:signal transduction histidine kinase/CheY-like chemotaxis protein